MDLFLTVIAIAIVAGLGYVAWIEWSKASTDQKWSMIETLVEAAEQTMRGEKAGAKRMDWIKERLQARFPGIDIEEAEDLIESAVYRLRQRSGVIVIEQPQEPATADDLHWFDGSGRHN